MTNKVVYITSSSAIA